MEQVSSIAPYKIVGKDILDYFVIYDLNDNVVAFCEDLKELSLFVNRPIRELRYRFKYKNIFQIQVPKVLNIYKFC